ncbi:IclR family transcriptional regulator [Anaerobacillus arseniciselenatis]|uniref:Glycerol operon regulatory protein n=1 Tax=Anaerobacillus arseniciselenatis TaxID=85682 RepID=A0A1S2LIP6_9BACI|nr:IclR family transcriptional regulator [Anaerobacillus arseniciselenatis]OIJ11557.1 IclR family transcriptional regulator [Anaerobacillus arseniciselenatis]
MPIIQAIDRALNILDLFDDHDKELKITDISQRMDLHKSTVHSLLKTLQKHNYIEQNHENGKYRLGMKFYERGNLINRNIELKKLAKEHLVKLSNKTGKTVHLVILDGKEGIYIDKVESSSATVLYSRIGRRVPINSSGVGKALIAFKSQNEIDNFLKDYDFVRQTENTIMDKESLNKEFEKVRKQGYAIDNEENELGVFCIAFPIKNQNGQVVAAISTSTTVTKQDEVEFSETFKLIKLTAERLSNQLGFRGKLSNK